MRRVPLLLTLLALLIPTAAHAGGWATARLGSSPDGTAAGETWTTKITVLQHGRTPLKGVTPAVVVTDAKGVDTRFEAKPTDEPGVYDVAVAFPVPGTYTYTVDDGFTNAFPRKFAPVTIDRDQPVAASSTTRGDDGGTVLPWLLAGVVVLLLPGAVAGAARRRRGTWPRSARAR